MMPEFIPVLGILGLSYLSLACSPLLSLGILRMCLTVHQHNGRAILLTLFAWLLLAFSLSACASDQGWAYGSILFYGDRFLAAMLVILTLATVHAIYRLVSSLAAYSQQFITECWAITSRTNL